MWHILWAIILGNKQKIFARQLVKDQGSCLSPGRKEKWSDEGQKCKVNKMPWKCWMKGPICSQSWGEWEGCSVIPWKWRLDHSSALPIAHQVTLDHYHELQYSHKTYLCLWLTAPSPPSHPCLSCHRLRLLSTLWPCLYTMLLGLLLLIPSRT